MRGGGGRLRKEMGDKGKGGRMWTGRDRKQEETKKMLE